MAGGKHQTKKETDHETAFVHPTGHRVTKQEVQDASEHVIERRYDRRALAETRVQKAEGRDGSAKQYGRTADGSEGDIRNDEESDRDARDLTTANALADEYEIRSSRITHVAVAPDPIIENKDVGRERDAPDDQ
jgi:hypothetical protein